MLKNKKAHHYPTKIMGCGFVITSVHRDSHTAWNGIRAAEAEMIRIEALISSWLDNSQTDQINKAAGIEPVPVDQELFYLIDRSIKISELTQGAFDISGTLSRYYWNFNRSHSTLPSEDKIEELRSLIDYKKIVLDPLQYSVFLKDKGMKIGFGGIGKGYAAQMAKNAMIKCGVDDGLINASGDLLCWGHPPNKTKWKISIPDPFRDDKALSTIKIPQGSVVTSGSNENYTLIDETRYSHIINPRTGMPVTHTKNVTVMCPDAEFGDALATAFSVLPVEESLGLANRLNGVECIILEEKNEIHFSNTLNYILNV